jgi:hypothetical protein
MTTRQETINKGSLFFHFFNRVQADLLVFAHKASEVRQAVRRRIVGEMGPRKTCSNRPSTACVLYTIRDSGKGVHPATLAQTTGYEKRKLDRILHKLFKHGEIMIEAGGVYVATNASISHALREH